MFDVFPMTLRPVYCWKSFWLGLLVLAGLGWAWARSMDRDEAVSIFGPGGFRFQAGISAGVAVVHEWEGDMDYDGRKVSGYSRELSEDQEVIPRRWAFLAKDEEMGGVWWIAFPMGFPFVGLLVSWSGWLVWRWRLERRGLKGTSNIERSTSNDE